MAISKHTFLIALLIACLIIYIVRANVFTQPSISGEWTIGPDWIFTTDWLATFVGTSTPANFNIYFPNTTSLRFQHPDTFNITLTVNTGNFNATNGLLTMTDVTGTFTFTNLEDTTISLNASDTDVMIYVNGATYTPDSPVSFSSGQSDTITWFYFSSAAIWLFPITFIIGMVGLGCMFVGPLYGIMLFGKKEYKDGLIWAVILTATGFALFLAWLWH